MFNRNPNTSWKLWIDWMEKTVCYSFYNTIDESGHKSWELILKKDNVEPITQYNPKLFNVNVEKHVIEDKFLLNAWDHIKRVNLVAKQNSLHSSFSTIFKIVQNNWDLI